MSGKRLIGQITLIKGNNVGRFHGRITMGLAGPFEYFPNARPATAAADMRALFPTHQCPVGSGFRWSSVVRKGRSCLPRNSRPLSLSLSLFLSLPPLLGESGHRVRRRGIKFVLPPWPFVCRAPGSVCELSRAYIRSRSHAAARNLLSFVIGLLSCNRPHVTRSFYTVWQGCCTLKTVIIAVRFRFGHSLAFARENSIIKITQN